MKFQLESALACIICLLCFQYILCDDLSQESGMNKWTCLCASAQQGNQSYVFASNCSTSCDCIPEKSVGGSSEERWTCICAAEGFSAAAAGIHDSTCFTACNCTSGLGGSSCVYRGQLKDGKIVAVKRLKTQGGPDAIVEFSTEIELISRFNHCHVVPLLGYCLESHGKQAERLLVFEYMSNGNLRDCLDGAPGKEPMDWGTRVNIALGAARGLEYLHEAAAPRILHRDIKSTNILLDDKWRPKISDLGMAKRLRTDDLPSCSNSPARMQGTFGYFAPEYAIVGRASLKSDVFSFGVVLLELISGRKPIQKSANKGEESLVIWATPRLQDSKRVILELPDPLLNGNFPEEEMQIMAYLAKECLLLDPDSRPTMSEVVQILSTITPEKSRRNFSLSLFQSLSTHSMKSVVDKERYEDEPDCSLDAENLRRGSAWSSLPLHVHRNLCVEDNKKEAGTVISAECIEKLNPGLNCRSPEDEIVDLTEPRFESFHMANIQNL
ncbi:PREDICTED: receptor-like serine/threonine-protein kinase NCRK isoform X5 [Nelumbo nucifera]|uniref:non-specific serine/threonine protein kinase n=1 Tax=Nelumbo nucifera TaxID=4432 RepID=A0A1U8APU2_NELNU|nr:PREDICTED: receptor-like serine/threonine-protein kinase NCRK isoform X5 [Nelumbo nucifera]